MTSAPTDKHLVSDSDRPQPSPPKTPLSGLRKHLSFAVQLILSAAVAGGVLAYLLYGGNRASSPDEEKRPSRPEEIVQIVGPRSIRIRPGTAMDSELHVATVRAAWLTSPLLPVTGAALASLRPGKDLSQDAWQFATPELLSAFSDWQKAVVDTKFQETQLKAIRELNESKIGAQREVVARMEKLVAAGTDTQKDLVAERTNLIQYQIQGRKDIHEAENERRRRPPDRGHPGAPASAGRFGADHASLRRRRGRHRGRRSARKAHGSRATRHDVRGAVLRPAQPRVYRESLLHLAGDLQGQARAERAVRRERAAERGTSGDVRADRPGDGQAAIAPHPGGRRVARRGKRLRAGRPAAPGIWKIVEVQVGELRGADVEALSGVKAGDRVLGQGAILLKPLVVRCLQSVDSPSHSAAERNPQEDGRGGGGSGG